VPATADIAPFQQAIVRAGKVDFSFCARPLIPSHLPGAKVYTPQILIHFIECTWAGCYNSIYTTFLSPHLDSPAVLDYVLRSQVISVTKDIVTGSTGAKIYGDLLLRLRGVKSPSIRRYLDDTFQLHG